MLLGNPAPERRSPQSDTVAVNAPLNVLRYLAATLTNSELRGRQPARHFVLPVVLVSCHHWVPFLSGACLHCADGCNGLAVRQPGNVFVVLVLAEVDLKFSQLGIFQVGADSAVIVARDFA
jgi:hypothetical protein